jgi:hypothetical protein
MRQPRTRGSNPLAGFPDYATYLYRVYARRKIEAFCQSKYAQLCAQFVHPVRSVVVAASDEPRSMKALSQAIVQRFNDDPFQRAIYSESHDEEANGKARPA